MTKEEAILVVNGPLRSGGLLLETKAADYIAKMSRGYPYLEHLESKDYEADAYEAKRAVFGTIVLERDLDLPPEIAYRTYDERWQPIKVNQSVEKMLVSLGLGSSTDASVGRN